MAGLISEIQRNQKSKIKNQNPKSKTRIQSQNWYLG